MDEDKQLSGEEKRAKMKEEFKKELMLRRQFLDKVKNLRSQQNILNALDKMQPQDDTDEWISKLNEQSAFLDAKTEIAIDAHKSLGDDASFLKSEQELNKAVAESLVEQMKKQMAEESKMSGLDEYQKENGIEPETEEGSKKTLGDF